MNLWKEMTLGEISDSVKGIIQTGPFGSQLHESDYSETGVPVIMPKNIIEGHVSENDIARVSAEHVERLAKHKLEKGDIVYGRRGDIGRQALVRDTQAGWLCGTGCLRISLGTTVIDPLFLHYYLRQESVIKWISAQAVGATMPNLNTGILRSVPVHVPPLPIQKRIAGILSAYDDLIENNQRRIKILEDMARSLYREWFIHFRYPGSEPSPHPSPNGRGLAEDFRYPGHDNSAGASNWTDEGRSEGVSAKDGTNQFVPLVDPPLGPIPQGWEVVALSDVYETASGGTPSRKVAEYYGCDYPWVKTKELKDGFILQVEESISTLGLKKSSAKLFPTNTVVIAMYGATIGRLGILSKPAATNQACAAILSKEEGFGRAFAFSFLKENKSELIGLGQGAAQQNISQAVIKNFPFLRPPTHLAVRFSTSVEPMFDSIFNLQVKNRNLRESRELLLPKLLSGEIDLLKVEEGP